MKIRLSEWANIAEIIGAVAIVLSLVFVGLQIEEGNRETRAATTQAALDAELAFQAVLIQHADVWASVVINEDFSDGVKVVQGKALFNMAMTLQDNRFQMMKSGYLTVSDESMKGMASFPFYPIWRQSIPAQRRSPEFLEYLDNLRESQIVE